MKQSKKVIEVSLFAANLANLNDELKRLKDSDVTAIHFDVMDNEFVPNVALSDDHMKMIDTARFEVNVHLMVKDPRKYIDRLKPYKVNAITFHCEPLSQKQIEETLAYIRSLGIKAGIAISPQTKVADQIKNIDNSDFITYMSVTPGFNGQPFDENAPQRLKEIRATTKNKDLMIEIDGGMRLNTAPLVKDYINYYVFGSTIMKQPDIAAVLKDIDQAIGK